MIGPVGVAVGDITADKVMPLLEKQFGGWKPSGAAAVEKLKARGLTSPYLKPFVVSRVNYTRFSKATTFIFVDTRAARRIAIRSAR